jgi:hypothetical protein
LKLAATSRESREQLLKHPSLAGRAACDLLMALGQYASQPLSVQEIEQLSEAGPFALWLLRRRAE